MSKRSPGGRLLMEVTIRSSMGYRASLIRVSRPSSVKNMALAGMETRICRPGSTTSTRATRSAVLKVPATSC